MLAKHITYESEKGFALGMVQCWPQKPCYLCHGIQSQRWLPLPRPPHQNGPRVLMREAWRKLEKSKSKQGSFNKIVSKTMSLKIRKLEKNIPFSDFSLYLQIPELLTKFTNETKTTASWWNAISCPGLIFDPPTSIKPPGRPSLPDWPCRRRHSRHLEWTTSRRRTSPCLGAGTAGVRAPAAAEAGRMPAEIQGAVEWRQLATWGQRTTRGTDFL